MLLVF
jgi:FMN phosphatase YigB (HAD superfamily)